MEEKVSVIVPVYNVSAYLEECIQSLINQTYSNLEIILVDDGSTDGSGEICDRYALSDTRIKVIHQENGGAGKAKNTALDVATGNYITFADSDDWLDLSFIERLLFAMRSTGADIVQCAFNKVRKSKTEYVETPPYGEFEVELYLNRFLKDWTGCLLWNKLFKKELMEDLRFYEGRVIDDEFFTYQAAMKAKKIVVISDALYYYRQRKTGVTNQGRWKQRMRDRLAYYTERYEKVTKQYPNLKIPYLENLMDNLMAMKNNTFAFKSCTKDLNRAMRKFLMTVIFSKVKFKQKLIYCKALLSKPRDVSYGKYEDAKWQDFYD